MKRFILKLSFSLVFFVAIYLCIYFIMLSISIKNLNTESIYVWGDSQIVQGLDLQLLEKKTNRPILSNAKHGAGVYDFIAFCNIVPKESDIILSLSRSLQLRRKDKDRNVSYLSFQAIFILLENNYSIKEIYEIVKRNRKPNELFSNESMLYECNEKFELTESLDFFKEIFDAKIEYLENKQNICLEGLKRLQKKNCKVHFIDFPFDSKLSEIELNSLHKKRTDIFENKIINNFVDNFDTLKLSNEQELMYDLTHLNKCGAYKVSNQISKKLNKHSRTYTKVIFH